MRKAVILQINNSFAGQNYLPYSAAILQSYFKGKSQASEEICFISPIYKRDSVNNIIATIDGVSIIGLSLYAWNTRLSLAVAKKYKAMNPECLVFAGGPSVPDDARQFLIDNPFIDIAIHNEGEIPVQRVLEKFINNEPLINIPSSSTIIDGVFRREENAPRIKTLENIPSPFLSGVLDKVIQENPSEGWIGLWETNRGCPFTCTYCDWGSATGSKKIGMFDMNRLIDEIEWFSKQQIEFLFCCDANFGMFPRDPLIAEMVGASKVKTGYPHALSVQNTKNSTERSFETQKILCDYGLNKGVTLSMQTLSDESLKNIKRSNIRLSSYFELQNRFIKEGVPTYSDLILALPGETLSSYITGLSTLIENGQHNRIQFNNLSILPNAEMAKPEYRTKYGIKTVITDIVNMHGSKSYEDKDITETQELVIETKSLPFEDWVSVRALSWMISFLYFDKVAQIPLSVANGALGVSMKNICEKLLSLKKNTPQLLRLMNNYKDFAVKISQGGTEYIYSENYLNIFWPPDELTFIEYTIDYNFKTIYDEIIIFLIELAQNTNPEIYDFYGSENVSQIINESCRFNHWALSTPNSHDNNRFTANWNIPEFYKSRLEGRFESIEKFCGPKEYILKNTQDRNLDTWLQEVVWYGNKRGAYLNDFDAV